MRRVLIGPTTSATVVVSFAGPSVTNATTNEGVATTSGLVISAGNGGLDTPSDYQITGAGFADGTLSSTGGNISSGGFISTAQSRRRIDVHAQRRFHRRGQLQRPGIEQQRLRGLKRPHRHDDGHRERCARP